MGTKRGARHVRDWTLISGSIYLWCCFWRCLCCLSCLSVIKSDFFVLFSLRSTSRSQLPHRSHLPRCASSPSTCPATAKTNLKPASTASINMCQGMKSVSFNVLSLSNFWLNYLKLWASTGGRNSQTVLTVTAVGPQIHCLTIFLSKFVLNINIRLPYTLL